MGSSDSKDKKPQNQEDKKKGNIKQNNQKNNQNKNQKPIQQIQQYNSDPFNQPPPNQVYQEYQDCYPGGGVQQINNYQQNQQEYQNYNYNQYQNYNQNGYYNQNGQQNYNQLYNPNNQKDEAYLIYLESFNIYLKDFDLVTEDIDSDGNCLFRCFADQCEKKPDEHLYYRQLCCEYIKHHQDDFIQFITEESVDKYVQNLGKEGVWGGDIEIIALCKALNVNVIVFQAGKNPVVFISPECVDVFKQKNVIVAYHEQFMHYTVVKLLANSSKTNNKANDYLYHICQNGLIENQLIKRQDELKFMKQSKISQIK